MMNSHDEGRRRSEQDREMKRNVNHCPKKRHEAASDRRDGEYTLLPLNW
jgi:hypothetical protein